MRLHPFGAAVVLAASVAAAHADTYSIYYLASSSGSVDNMGFTNGGNSAVLLDAAYCSTNTSSCYVTFTPKSSYVSSSTEPTLDGGNGPGDYVLSAKRSTSPDSPLSVLNQATQASTLILTGNWGNALIDSFGDVLLTEYSVPYLGVADVNVLAVNETAHAAAVTPEPSSFALLGTGLLGLTAAVRRRFARA